VCTTIFPHNAVQPDPHLWIKVRVQDSRGVIECELYRVSEVCPLVPVEYVSVLWAVHKFVFGEGSAMARLWLWWVTTVDRPCGPRQHIVESLNTAVAGQLPDAACERLHVLAEECMKLPWPIESYVEAVDPC
jgi:hypothetical protein